MNNLRLYYKSTCPYCQKVLRFMNDNNIQIELRSTLEPGNQKHLCSCGGKDQVPCLFIGESALYESDDIIAYLSKQFA